MKRLHPSPKINHLHIYMYIHICIKVYLFVHLSDLFHAVIFTKTVTPVSIHFQDHIASGARSASALGGYGGRSKYTHNLSRLLYTHYHIFNNPMCSQLTPSPDPTS